MKIKPKKISSIKINKIKKKSKEKIKVYKPQLKSESINESEKFKSDLNENVELISNLIGDSNDVKIKDFLVGKNRIDAVVISIDGLADQNLLNNYILKTLMQEIYKMELLNKRDILQSDILNEISKIGMTMVGVSTEDSLKNGVVSILSGDSLFLLDNCSVGLVLQTKGWEKRSVQEPSTETLIRGPREGFTENIRTNTALIRRYLRDTDLKIIGEKLGRRSKKDYALVYVEGIVNKDILKEVKKRLETINTDQILDSGYVEQYIEDSFLSPFPQVQSTERPDKMVAAITEGRVGLLIDGTPFALIVPAVFGQFFQSPEDYYSRWILGSFMRTLRLFASYFATFTPAFYIAVSSFHPGLMPTKLAMSIAAAREGVPFPAFVEALIMELSFELFREAGARLPRPIGQTVGIVGGLIVGQAAVSAKLASPIMIIVVALTAIAGFSIPSFTLAEGFRILRFPLMIAAAVFGLYGVTLGFIIINIHMVSLKSFGKSYLAPFVPYRIKDFKDLFIRAPLRSMEKRPDFLEQQDEKRQDNLRDQGW
jgi:spore germination protein